MHMHNRLNDRAGFTMVDLLVVLAVLLCIFSMSCSVFESSGNSTGDPAEVRANSVGSARQSARNAQSLTNIRAMTTACGMYLMDNKDVYPAAAGDALHEVNLLGARGEGDDSRAKVDSDQRLLHRYIPDPRVAQCPQDTGTSQTAHATAFKYYGSSYLYLNRDEFTEFRGRDRVWVIEGHRNSEIAVPSRKLIATSMCFFGPKGDAKSYWYAQGDPVMVPIGYADGHAAFTRRKVDPDGKYGNIDASTIQAWFVEEYY